MSGPISPEDRAVGQPERLHPLFLLNGLGGSLRGLVGGYAFVAYLVVSGQLATALLVAIVFLAVAVVGVLLYWTRFEFRVGEDEIRIDSGILSRRHRSIPFDRIHDVDITQGLVARLLGLAEVKFETGGGTAGPNSEEGVLPAITLERAEQIRALVRAGRRIHAPSAEIGEPEREELVYALSPGRLLLAGVFNFSLAVFAGLIGLTQTFGDALGFDPLSESFWRKTLSASDPIADYVLAHRPVAILAGSSLLLLLGLATGLVRTTLRDWGFRLGRAEAGLRRRRGLLTRTDVTLPVRRAQAVILRSGPVRDAFGWTQVRLQSLARDEGGSGDHMLAPLATKTEADRILGELGWRGLAGNVQWRRVSKAYVWMQFIALVPFLLLAGLVAALLLLVPLAELPVASDPLFATFVPLLFVAVLALGGVGAAMLLRWLAWRRTAYVHDGDRLLIRSGWWRRRLVVLPTARIQSIDFTENFATRWFGAASLHFGVAGGTFRGEIIPAIPRMEARTVRDELLVSLA
jgi:putative membrane protein